ncbi:hypothetical protein FACS1894102_4300 [Spirochaetia bacterium]|nr:hypothetical protein FACS1894102_4300 [Spirochaetia bacterium]
MLALSAVVLFAQNQAVTLSIKYYDKQLYYTNSGDIYVQLTITNNSPDLYRFRLCEDRAFSVNFDTRFLNNKAVEDADVLLRRRSTSAQVFFRDVMLESGESFSFTENLRDFSKINSQGQYIVQASFYPEIYRASTVALDGSNNGMFLNIDGGSFAGSSKINSLSNMKPLVSNRLNLQIRPPVITDEDGIPTDLATATGAVLVRERLAPDDVVTWTLNARQRSQWEKFFLYLDLEAMIARDAGRQRQWRVESEEGRMRMMARYRNDLQSAKIDGDIASIPSEFKIERTLYGEDEGTVTVQEKFKYKDFTERKRYTYYLQRKDGIWNIVDYTVVNLGTE